MLALFLNIFPLVDRRGTDTEGKAILILAELQLNNKSADDETHKQQRRTAE